MALQRRKRLKSLKTNSRMTLNDIFVLILKSAVESKGRLQNQDRIGSDRIGPDRTGPDRTGPDRIGSERTGPDRTRTGSDRMGSDRQNPDWFNIKIPANRHMKSLGYQLRLLPTFTGVLPEKVRTRVSIKS